MVSLLKLLRLSQTSVGKTAAGQLVNIMSNDVQRFERAGSLFHFLWVMPLHFIGAFYIMYRSVGLASISGMVLMGLQAMPLQGKCYNFKKLIQTKQFQKNVKLSCLWYKASCVEDSVDSCQSSSDISLDSRLENDFII